MPEPGKDETVRVVALEKNFHMKCYKCEVILVAPLLSSHSHHHQLGGTFEFAYPDQTLSLF